MSSTKSTKPPPTMTAPWTEPAPLADVDGGERNLLHRSAWSDPDNPLKVMLKPWYDGGDPPDGPWTEQVDVFLDDDESNIIGSREWDLPMDLDDYYVPISADRLPSGTHTLSFIMTNFVGTPDRSHPFTVTVDKSPPTLAADSKLIFPSEVLPPNHISAAYLADPENNDQVLAGIPRHTEPRPGDHIIWYWGERPSELNQGGKVDIDPDNPDSFVITVPGDLIRERGDGWRYVSYRAWDRAGNESLISDPAAIEVAATPIPRSLPWPSVENASGTGEEQALDPLEAKTGGFVNIPPDAVIHPGEQVWVQWGEPGTVGACKVEAPVSSDPRCYAIPMSSVAAHIGKTLSVSYGVIDGNGKEWPSDTRRLKIQTLSATVFPTVQCRQARGNQLPLVDVPPGGAELALDYWVMMTTDQWLMINITAAVGGEERLFTALDKRPVTEEEINEGIGMSGNVVISKAFLDLLSIGSVLAGKVYISFDGGNSWPPLATPSTPSLQLTLV